MKKIGNFKNMWKLNSMLLEQSGDQKAIKREIKTYLRQKWKCSIPKLWYASKAVLQGKFLVINAYLKKRENAEINNMILRLKN